MEIFLWSFKKMREVVGTDIKIVSHGLQTDFLTVMRMYIGDNIIRQLLDPRAGFRDVLYGLGISADELKQCFQRVCTDEFPARFA